MTEQTKSLLRDLKLGYQVLRTICVKENLNLAACVADEHMERIDKALKQRSINYKAAHSFARKELREVARNTRERLIAARIHHDTWDVPFWEGAIAGKVDALASAGVITIKGRDSILKWVTE